VSVSKSGDKVLALKLNRNGILRYCFGTILLISLNSHRTL